MAGGGEGCSLKGTIFILIAISAIYSQIESHGSRSRAFRLE